jgi:hypothetical protein
MLVNGLPQIVDQALWRPTRQALQGQEPKLAAAPGYGQGGRWIRLVDGVTLPCMALGDGRPPPIQPASDVITTRLSLRGIAGLDACHERLLPRLEV